MTTATTASTGIGLKRLQHLILWVSDLEGSVRFYRDVLGFEVKSPFPHGAFLRIPGSADDHHLGCFEQPGGGAPRRARRAHVPLGLRGRRAHGSRAGPPAPR
jgi:catechol 2,3-dioxygenase-like lactoylglutathione lyase family enzyme